MTEYAEEDLEYKRKYNNGDYFQQTMTSSPVGHGLGGLMHDF